MIKKNTPGIKRVAALFMLALAVNGSAHGGPDDGVVPGAQQQVGVRALVQTFCTVPNRKKMIDHHIRGQVECTALYKEDTENTEIQQLACEDWREHWDRIDRLERNLPTPRTFANAATGYLVEWLGWENFFLFCFVIAIPGMLFLFKVAPWNGQQKITSLRGNQ